MMWKLEDGLALVRSIQQPSRKYGYHVAMGGSVLNKGQSDKDLDLYFLPMGDKKTPEKPSDLIEWLTTLWGRPEQIGKDYLGEPDISKEYLAAEKPAVMEYRNPHRFAVQPPDYRYNLNQWLVSDQELEKNIRSGYITVSTPQAEAGSPYKFKLKFIRPSDQDRIDIFIM